MKLISDKALREFIEAHDRVGKHAYEIDEEVAYEFINEHGRSEYPDEQYLDSETGAIYVEWSVEIPSFDRKDGNPLMLEFFKQINDTDNNALFEYISVYELPENAVKQLVEDADDC